jgi:hypothetical protein
MPLSAEDEQVLNLLGQLDTAQFEEVCPLDLRHYNETQLKWIQEAKFLEGVNQHRAPSELDVCRSLEEHSTPQRFRAYYALKYPHRVQSARGNWLERLGLHVGVS